MERAVAIFNLILLAFIATNMETNLGLTFGIFAIVSYLFFISDKSHTVLIQKKNNILKSLFLGILGWAGSLVVGYLLVNILGGLKIIQTASIASVPSLLSTIAQFQSTLAFSGSTVWNFIAFAILVPIVETQFFCGTTFEFLLDMFKVSISRLSFKLVAIFLLISSVFTAFHFTSKGVGNDVALVAVFSFMLVSLILVLYEKQLAGAILMHIIANGVALSLKLGLFASLSLGGIIVVIIGVIFVLLSISKVKVGSLAIFEGG